MYKMYNSGVFVFGSSIFPEDTKPDIISALPLELSWKIFSYLDGISLKTATRVHKVWRQRIVSNSKLRKRLNHFELVAIYGSERLVKYYENKKTTRRRTYRKNRTKNYVATGSSIVEPAKPAHLRKREAVTITVNTKRIKLF